MKINVVDRMIKTAKPHRVSAAVLTVWKETHGDVQFGLGKHLSDFLKSTVWCL